MSNGQPYLPKPGMDERLAVEEMLRDQASKHWEEYSKFVEWCVYAKAKNIPSSLHDDIVQDIMCKVIKYLPHFRFQCTLKTWLNTIIEHCIIDAHRKLQNEGWFHSNLADLPNDGDREGEISNANVAASAEDAFEINDKLRSAVTILLEYINTHANSVRNRLIIRMVIFEGKTHEAAARAAGCNAPVVGYVVHEAQRYVRENMDRKP